MSRMIVFISIFLAFLLQTEAHAGLGFLTIFIPKTHPRCEKAYPPNHPNFCATFKVTAQCACASSGLPTSQCSDMKQLHKRMLMVFDTQQKACDYQHDTSSRQCNDSWNCYWNGGKDSNGRLCQQTGKSCLG